MKSTTSVAIVGITAFGLLSVAGDKAELSGNSSRLSWHKEPVAVTRHKLETALTVKDFLGAKVVNAEGERLGKVVDFILESDDGKFANVVIARGGLLGMHRTYVAVPYNKIEHLPGTRNLVWNIAKADFLTVAHKARKTRSHEMQTANVRTSAPGPTARGASWNQTRQPSLSGQVPIASAQPNKPAIEDAVNKIKAMLGSEPTLAARVEALNVTQEQNKVIIRGEVESVMEKKRIMQLASKATTQEIVDQIAVNPSLSSTR